MDSSVHLIYHDPSDLQLLILIRIIPKEHSHIWKLIVGQIIDSNNAEKDTTLLLFFLSESPGGHVISFQIKQYLELHLGCHTCWLSYLTLVCLWCGRWVYSHVITKFSRKGRLPHFFSYGAPTTRGASRSAWSSAKKLLLAHLEYFLYFTVQSTRWSRQILK